LLLLQVFILSVLDFGFRNLGRAYALQGDAGKARTAYQDFFAMWKDADADIPVLVQAKAEYGKLSVAVIGSCRRAGFTVREFSWRSIPRKSLENESVWLESRRIFCVCSG
jgi:hypothetical protein